MVPSIIVKLCVQILHQDIITESPEVNDPGLLFQGNKWRENRGNRVSITIFKLWRKQGSTEENLEQLQGIKYFVMLVVKNWPANLGNKRDVGLIPGSRRSPGEGNDNPLQYSCLENPMDRGAWWATAHRVAKSRTRLNALSRHTCRHKCFLSPRGKGT